MSTPFIHVRSSAYRRIAVAYLAAANLMLACSSTVATAADMPMPTKAPEPSVYQWSGCYIGANIGGGTGGTNFGTTVDPGTYLAVGDAASINVSGNGGANADGLLGGGQLGCNWQVGTLVLGFEGDFDSFHSNPNFNNNTNTLPSTGAAYSIAQSLTTNYLATVRPRIGIAADRNFAYLTGGAAFTHVSYTETYTDANGPPGPGPGGGTATAARSLVGWTAGAGWEYALADHWTFRAEYLFASFPTTNALGIVVAPGATNTLHGSTDLVVQLIRAGVNFKF